MTRMMMTVMMMMLMMTMTMTMANTQSIHYVSDTVPSTF